MRRISGMAMARVGIKGYLSMERKYAQVQVQRGAQEPNQRTKTRKTAKRKSCENQCHKPIPLRKISSSRFGCSGNHHKLTVLRNFTASQISCHCILFPRWYPIYICWGGLLHPVHSSDRMFFLNTSHPFLLISILISYDLYDNEMSCHRPNTDDTHTIFGVPRVFICGMVLNPLYWPLWEEFGLHG